MVIHIDIYLNQLSQNIISQQEGCVWFNSLEQVHQLEVLRKIAYFAMQAGARGKDVPAAINESALKSTYTPCQLLLKAYQKEPEGSGTLSSQLAAVINLPLNERAKSFQLLLSLFRVADMRKRAQGVFPERYWWHRDLSKESVVRDLLLEWARNKGNAK